MANSYVDGINVKISEKYKPPCRISMPISYSQRITLNKQLQDSRPSYDFHLERSAIEKVKELKEIRRDLAEERKQRLELAKDAFNKKIEKEKSEKLEKEQTETKLLEESSKATINTEIKTQDLYNSVAGPNLNQPDYQSNPSQSYITKNGILMPIPVTNYSPATGNILKPIPTSNMAYEPPQSTIKSFNLSDFESDTSSPFDNMELKSINDLEELAQVLKSDRTNFHTNVYPNTTMYQAPATKSYGNLPASNFPQTTSAYGRNPTMYNPNSSSLPYNPITTSYSQVNTTYNPLQTIFSQYNHPYASPSNYQVPSAISNYSTHPNGYLYNMPTQMTSQVQLNHPYVPYISSVSQPSMQKSNCKSVPDLVKSLETELDNTHLNCATDSSRHSISSSYTTTDVPVPTRPKSTDSVFPKTKVKEKVFDPLEKLSWEEKEVCRNVSLMGFPLDRVVRVYEAVGCDQKKIVDHLLALSELLDLGFSEKDASEALMKNDNDRDKALDLLIS